MIFKSLSVIFPLLNEEKRLTYAFNDIQKFNKKKLAKKLEYIFVDDGSTDNSFKIIKEFISKNSSKNIRCQEKSGAFSIFIIVIMIIMHE